jgi:hypothetical protein
MMRHPRRGSGTLLGLAFVLTLTTAPGTALAAPRAQGPLTGSSSGDALDIVTAYLRANHARYGLNAADLKEITVTDRYQSTHSGVTHLYLRQQLSGIDVVGAEINANVAADGSVLSLDSSFIGNLRAAVRGGAARRTAEAAVQEFARGLGLSTPARLKVNQNRGGPDAEVVFGGNGISLEPITARLVYQPVGQRVVLAWQVELYEPDADHWWNARLDASSGEVLATDDYVSSADDAYNVFEIPAENPDEGDRTLVLNPASVGSPFGWHDTDGDADPDSTTTSGNNVHAYPDRNNNNTADEATPDGGAGLVFDFELDLTRPPVDYQDAATTNLFYWNNVIHDVLYGYGFDERAGNFQLNNYGNHGKDGDYVRAEAQDGSGRNNANFATPPDGQRPRMQMFEWRSAAPNPMLALDGALAGQTFFGPMAGFGNSLVTTGPIEGRLVVIDDGVAPTGDGCQAFTIEAGDIPLIDRGACNFTVKVKNAEVAGADAAVVANNVPGDPFGMGGADPSITIPSIMISLADGTTVKGAIPFSVRLSDGTGGAPDRDSDLDSGVIVHEYGHGVSNRLTGGPGNAGCLQNAEQMGEGWSDFLALVLTARDSDTATTSRGVGNYVVFQDASGIGIRPTPYSTDLGVDPATYQTVISEAGTTLTIPHGVGYVWASMLWDVYWNLVEAHGFNPDIYADWSLGGNTLALQLVIDGMKFQPCSPGFVQGRDAILTADLALTDGANQCLIWEGFAKRGLGYSAEQRSSKKTADGTAAFDLSPECSAGAGAVVMLPPAALLGSLSGRHRRRVRRPWTSH